MEWPGKGPSISLCICFCCLFFIFYHGKLSLFNHHFSENMVGSLVPSASFTVAIFSDSSLNPPPKKLRRGNKKQPVKFSGAALFQILDDGDGECTLEEIESGGSAKVEGGVLGGESSLNPWRMLLARGCIFIPSFTIRKSTKFMVDTVNIRSTMDL